jgi:nucleoside-diphosphate-sugar epimerase
MSPGRLCSVDVAGVECIVSGAKARRELGYAPRVSYEEAMAETT